LCTVGYKLDDESGQYIIDNILKLTLYDKESTFSKQQNPVTT